MSSVVIAGDTSGSITLQAPAVAGSNTITLPASTGYLFVTPTAGVLGVDSGGTGLSSLTSGYIPFGAGTSAFGSSSNLFWDNTNARLGIGTATPVNAVDISGTINATGQFLGGSTTAVTPGFGLQIPKVQSLAASAQGSILASHYGNNANSSAYYFIKSRSGTVGTQGAVSNGDGVGSLLWQASDGTNYITTAQIAAFIDNTPGTSDMPGRLVFLTTPDGSPTPAERMRITSNGGVSFGSSGTGYGTAGQFLKSNGDAAPTWAAAGLTFQSVQATGFTAAVNSIYPCNTTSAGFTVTLPASPTAGDQVCVYDYAGTFRTNNLTISPNGNKIQGDTANAILSARRESTTMVYTDATQGWVAISSANESSNASLPQPYSASYVIVGGGGGAGGNGGGGGGAGGFVSGTTTLTPTTTYTVSIGAGGNGVGPGVVAGAGGSSSFTGLTTALGGGYGGSRDGGGSPTGGPGGSGGGGAGAGSAPVSGGTGTPGQGNNGGSGLAGGAPACGGGGGGASAAGSSAVSANTGAAGGNGTATALTGTPATYAGGGGGGTVSSGTGGTGGSGGGGPGGGSGVGTAGTVNTGGGGGGGGPSSTGGNGGSGRVILSVPTANAGTASGTYTSTTNGSNTVYTWTAPGTYIG